MKNDYILRIVCACAYWFKNVSANIFINIHYFKLPMVVIKQDPQIEDSASLGLSEYNSYYCLG